MRHRIAVTTVFALVLATAGCVGTLPGAQDSAGTPTATAGPETPTATPTGPGTATATAGPGTPTASGESGTSTVTPTATPSGSPTGPPSSAAEINISEGPKESPGRPPALNESSVREYVRTYEYRIAYNSLWVNENSTVTLACRVDGVTERSWGYGAVVTCTGSSETNGLNGDWFTQSYRYRITETAQDRTQIEPRDPVSTE